MKKNRVIRWVLLIAALGFVFFVGSHLLLHFGGWGQRNMAVMQMQDAHRGMFREGFHQGGMGMMGGMGMRGMKHIGRAHEVFGFGSIILALIIAGIGWFLRKNAKGSSWKKWGGWLLIAIGTLMFIRRAVPLVVFIVIGIVIWKLLTKGKKEPKVETLTVDHSLDSIHPVSNKTGNMLDEWESNISKEEH